MFLYKKDFMALKNQTNVWNYMLKMQEKNQASVNRHIAKTNQARKYISDNISRAIPPQLLDKEKLDVQSVASTNSP